MIVTNRLRLTQSNHLIGAGHGMERKFWYGIRKMPEWNGRFQEWNKRHFSIPIPYYILCMIFTEKYIKIVINVIVIEVFYTYLIICGLIAVLRFCALRKQCTYCIIAYTAICSSNAKADN